MSQMAIFLLGLVPVLAGACVHFGDAYDYINEIRGAKITKWMGYPVALMWYAFLAVALQIHAIELYYANTLITAWQPKVKTK